MLRLRNVKAKVSVVLRAVAGTLIVFAVVAFSVDSSLALVTQQSTVNMTFLGVGPNPEVEYININGTPKTVYMGPYKVAIPGDVSPFTYVMCFNAGASAASSLALSTNTAGASNILGWSQEKINMIAWLASQWEVSNSPNTQKNANINKAMWEVMADYDGNIDHLTVANGNGNFYLTNNTKINNAADISYVDSLLQSAFEYKGITTDANFLIPGWWSSTDQPFWIYDTTKQPFVVQPVPEPATLLLLGSGLVGLGLHGWRKRSKAQK